MAHARTIVETDFVASEIEAAQMKYPRFEEAWVAWSWRIARGPDWGYAVPGYANYYMVRSHSGFVPFGVPHFTILYEIADANTVRITGIRFV